ncbi:putative F420-dependent oxidoreductase [Saccharothrix carnea]|uniref:Putative F420-dependent oxidoreductase n=1 Tax=Saccharothrix carnea TaxID=1280637 RepID=A0A2P8HIL7_SACCR|nr:TIGR03621 family F420-dependent LLM class oxidoreductase [Saccharothrix carnea]PSL46020.1 putative F420-dependent oxidoreductase [Saccharothrix carnea]
MTTVHERPFRFGVTVFTPVERAEWVAKARLAEQLGFDVIQVSDHLGMPAPLLTLMLAAEATERIRLGTLVLNTTFYEPAVLARDIRTLDRYSGGRVEVGLGAGYERGQFDAAGIPWTPAAERVAHLARTVDRLKELAPAPVVVAGRGDRVLRLAAERADVVAFTGTTRVRDGEGLKLGTVEELADRVEFVHAHLGDRVHDVELNIAVHRVLPPGGDHAITDVWQNDLDLTTDQLVELPSMLIGTPEECVEQLHEARKRFGISYFSVLEPEMMSFARVIEAMR